jgi:integrase
MSDTEWTVPVQGRRDKFRFARTGAGMLQRKLVTLTQANHSPSSIVKFTRSLINKWQSYVEILEQGPEGLRDLWDDKVLDVDTAKAGKKLLKLACKHEVGPWTSTHLPMVVALDTRAKRGLLAQQAKVKRRLKVLRVSTQAEVVRILDESSLVTAGLPEDSVEGLSALALIFQHGMRPVQLLALGLEHLSEPILDPSSTPAPIVSFHWGKNPAREAADLHRSVKPEWVPLINQLRQNAIVKGRDRLFSCTTSDALWSKVRRACKSNGLSIDFKAYGLRHTSIQALADAGHDRKSIQVFAGHSTINAATTYLRATKSQAKLINAALGISKLYGKLEGISKDSFVSVEQMVAADEDMQIGGIVGERLIAGIGLCASGQSACLWDPVTSCYGCKKFRPFAGREPHVEAIAGMREQVMLFVPRGDLMATPALTQLSTALAGAQQALEIVDRLLEARNE